MDPHYIIRLICANDDVAVAALIHNVLQEFEPGAGYAPTDAELGAMSQTYCAPRSAYFVVEAAGEVVGGAGVGPLAGAPFEVCELR